ncbi:hypothetical protein O0L34_g3750 [Tuta absoluta]|nr:hypothetical protein O0L34_g3750 [Tuta absoluta]
MMRHVLLAFAVAVILDTLSFAEAHEYKYITSHKEGQVFSELPMGTPTKRRIPAGQCSGLLEFPRDYACRAGLATAPPNMLEVTALDDEQSPKITFSQDLENVTIEREFCETSSLILIKWNCLQL